MGYSETREQLLNEELSPEMRFINAYMCLLEANKFIQKHPLIGGPIWREWIRDYDYLIYGIIDQICSNCDMQNLVSLARIINCAKSYTNNTSSLVNDSPKQFKIGKVTVSCANTDAIETDVTFYINKLSQNYLFNKELSLNVSILKPDKILFTSYSKSAQIYKEKTLELVSSSINARIDSTTDDELRDDLIYALEAIKYYILNTSKEVKRYTLKRKKMWN